MSLSTVGAATLYGAPSTKVDQMKSVEQLPISLEINTLIFFRVGSHPSGPFSLQAKKPDRGRPNSKATGKGKEEKNEPFGVVFWMGMVTGFRTYSALPDSQNQPTPERDVRVYIRIK